jgi:hypothetical protein
LRTRVAPVDGPVADKHDGCVRGWSRWARLPPMQAVDHDWLVRQHTFRFLEDLHGRPLMVVPRRDVERPDPDRLEARYEQFRAAG